MHLFVQKIYVNMTKQFKTAFNSVAHTPAESYADIKLICNRFYLMRNDLATNNIIEIANTNMIDDIGLERLFDNNCRWIFDLM